MKEKFFTWVEEKYENPNQVPARLQNYIRTLYQEGGTVEMLALATNLPEDWVAVIVREDPHETKPN
ncbi:hypothetical protein [Bradyrhizobium cenepequi]